MITLDATTDSLEVKLGGAVTTNQLPFTTSYADLNTSTFAVTAFAENEGTTNNTTAVTLVAAPGASKSRKISLVNIYNADTVAATVTVQYNANGTLRVLCKIALAADSTLQYTDGGGWKVVTSAGGVVTTSSTHALLDGSIHSDTSADAVSRGSLIYGNSTPAWDELVIGAANTVLKSDGTDAAWSALEVFKTISVSGQSDIVADSLTDTLIVAAGSGITLTTNAGTDTLTIAASGSSMEQIFRGLHLRTSPNADVAATTVTLLRADAISLDDGTYVEDWDDLSAVISSSGAGGLDTGAEAASTWYEIYAIRKSSDGTKNLLLHQAKDYFLDESQTTDNNAYTLRTSAVSQVKLGQSFQVTNNKPIDFVDARFIKVGTPTGATQFWFTIEADSSGAPSGTPLATSDKLDATLVSTSAQWIRFPFRSPLTPTAATTYWLVAQGSYDVSGTNTLKWGNNSAGGYASGTGAIYNGTSWSNTTDDFAFKIYTTRNDASVTMPSGYDQKCKVGYVYNDSGSHLDPFVAQDRYVQVYQVQTIGSITATIPTLTDVSAFFPPGPIRADIVFYNGTLSAFSYVAGAPNGYDVTGGSEPGPGGQIVSRTAAAVAGTNVYASLFTEYQGLYAYVSAGTEVLSVVGYRW